MQKRCAHFKWELMADECRETCENLRAPRKLPREKYHKIKWKRETEKEDEIDDRRKRLSNTGN